MASVSVICTPIMALALSAVLAWSSSSYELFHQSPPPYPMPPCSSYQPIYGGL